MEVLFADALTPADAHAIATLLYRVWPRSTRSFDERLQRVSTDWADYGGPSDVRPRYFVIWEPADASSAPGAEERTAVASALAAPRTIRTGAGEMTVLALARVCSLPERRGKGLGAQVVRAAFQLVDEGTYPFALFQTTPDVRPFYEKLGACPVENKFINSRGDDPGVCPFWNEVILRYPASGSWPDGVIDLQGPGY
jgi:GNAT superfamily N-acetyltransferase